MVMAQPAGPPSLMMPALEVTRGVVTVGGGGAEQDLAASVQAPSVQELAQ